MYVYVEKALRCGYEGGNSTKDSFEKNATEKFPCQFSVSLVSFTAYFEIEKKHDLKHEQKYLDSLKDPNSNGEKKI